MYAHPYIFNYFHRVALANNEIELHRMFDFFKNSKIIKALLVIIVVSFIYFGLGGAFFSNSQYLVEIGDIRITNFDVSNYLHRFYPVQDVGDIDQAYRALQKKSYLVAGGKRLGIEISPNQVSKAIKSEPSFRGLSGAFNIDLYNNFIVNAYYSPILFEGELKNNIIVDYIHYYANDNHVIPDNQLKQYLSLYETKKEIQSVSFLAANYKNQVNYNDNDLKNFYTEHKEAYTKDESIQFEYLCLTPEWMMDRIKVPAEEIKDYYENNKAKSPRRMVSQIVFAFPKAEVLSESVKLALKQQAEFILKQAQQAPEKFSFYAEKYSQDASTAKFGGSLGLIEQNEQYYAAIEDAVFGLKTGQIYNQLVETSDGYHILKVDAAMNWKSFFQDKPGIEYVLRYSKIKDRLVILRDQLSEASFKESTNLAKVSQDILGDNLVQSSNGWVTKKQALLAGLPVEVIEVLFDHQSISDQVNSDVIHVGSDYWVVRVTKVQPAQLLSFDEVRDQVVRNFILQKAEKLANTKANQVFKQLESGQVVALNWSHPVMISAGDVKNDFSLEEFVKFLSTHSQGNHPGYYLLDKRLQPTIVRVNSEKLDYPFSQDKITLAFEKSRDIFTKKNEIAILAYLHSKIRRKTGNVRLTQ